MDGETKGELDKKPEPQVIVIANVTPAGAGVPSLIDITPIFDGIIFINFDLSNYQAADTASIWVEKAIDAVNYVPCGKIEIIAGIVSELLGVPYMKIAGIAVGDILGVEFCFSQSPGQPMRLSVIQNVGAIMRQLNYSYQRYGMNKQP